MFKNVKEGLKQLFWSSLAVKYSRKSQVDCTLEEKVKLAVDSEEEVNWLLRNKSQIICQFGDVAIFFNWHFHSSPHPTPLQKCAKVP